MKGRQPMEAIMHLQKVVVLNKSHLFNFTYIRVAIGIRHRDPGWPYRKPNYFKMKKIVLTALLATTGLLLQAQKLNKAKDLLSKNKLTEAKTEIDGVLENEKNKTSSESWYTKAKIYLAINKDEGLKSTLPNAKDEAFDAMKKYMDLESEVKEESKRHILLTLENNQPLVDLYAGYSKDAATFYNAGNFNDALAYFKHTLEVFSFMVDKKLITNVTLDTTTTLYAGISAEKAKKIDEAAEFYTRIAEQKATGEGFVEIYKWLADYHRRKDDIAAAQKFTQLGREVYPENPFWTSFELEMLSEQGGKEDLFKKYEQVILENPDNHLYLFNYAVELYQAGYTQEKEQRPANSKELIGKARETLKKCLAIKNDYPNAHMVLGQIAYNEGVDINNENKDIRPPQGGRLTQAQLDKKEELRQAVVVKFDEAIPHFKKVDELLDGQGKLKMEDKDILKNALDLMIIAFEEKAAQLEQKRNQAEVKKQTADFKKYEAELKTLQDEISKYTDKYNNVDRNH